MKGPLQPLQGGQVQVLVLVLVLYMGRWGKVVAAAAAVVAVVAVAAVVTAVEAVEAVGRGKGKGKGQGKERVLCCSAWWAVKCRKVRRRKVIIIFSFSLFSAWPHYIYTLRNDKRFHRVYR